jgi:predicted dehydrogenase
MTLGIGLVGTGLMGGIYAETLAEAEVAARLVAVTGGRRAAEFAAERAVPHASTLDELLAMPEVEAVIIATPHSVHLEQTLAAAAAGRHVLLEKPMALDAAQCRQMVEAGRRAGVVITVGHITRWMDASVVVRRMIDEGEVGTVHMVQAVRALAGGLPYTSDSWAQDPAEGGPLLDWGSHGCDVLRWFAGADAELVFGQVTTFEAGVGAMANAVAHFTFANGVLGHLLMTHELPHAALGGRSRYLIIGSRAMLELSAYGQVRRSRPDGSWEVVYRSDDFVGEEAAWGYPNDYLRAAFRRQVSDLVGAVVDGTPLGVTAEDGMRAVEMVEAVLRSARTGQTVRLGG